MRLDLATPVQIRIALSRRNLLTLLAKLDGHPPFSDCTIIFPGSRHEPTLYVHGEDDLTHYGRRLEPPGPMHPETEAWVEAHD